MADAAPTALTATAGTSAPAASPAIEGAAAAAAPSTATTTTQGASTTAAPAAAPAAPVADAKPAAEPAKPAAETKMPESSLLDPKKDAAAKDATKTEGDPAKTATPSVTYDLKFPEDMKLTDEEVSTATKLLSEANVPADKAQPLVDFYAGQIKTLNDHVQKEATERQINVWKETNDKWVEAVKKDPVIGGSKLDATLSSVSKIMDEFGKDIPTLRQTLTMTGAGNHPDIIRFLNNVSKALTEGKSVAATKAAPVAKASRSKTLYDGNKGA